MTATAGDEAHDRSSVAGASPRTRHEPLPRAVRAIVFAAFLAALGLALSFPLLDPDEGRNAEVGREMAVSGDLVVPHLGGMPYLDKPVGLFWAEALAIRLLGPTPLAARLPAIVAAIATLLILGRVANDLAGPSFAASAVGLLAVAPLFVGLSAYVIFDMPLTACVTVIWTSLAREMAGERASHVDWAWRYVAIALGVLLKGPIMLAWAIGGSVAVTLLVRSLAPLRWLGFVPGWLIVFGLAGGWFTLASLRHPEYPHYAFLEESLERLTGNSFQRDQPLWFVPAVLVGGALPWTLLTPWRRALAGPTPAAAAASRVALGFVLFAAVGFSISRSKLVTYLLPAFPPLAWLGAAAWSSAPHAWGRAHRAVRTACFVIPVLGLVAAMPSLLRYARAHSGAGLAHAIRAAAPGAPIRYERCYSAGTQYLLGRSAEVVSESGRELRSSYQIRYRDTLIARGQWTPLANPSARPLPEIVVRSARDPEPAPGGCSEFFRDARYVAYRRDGR
jgi:4-amino-4-deoxy-L-arabinose transferase-like glycosyltransferase